MREPEQANSRAVIAEPRVRAVLDRMDETREMMVQFWVSNPHLAAQGGARVRDLIESREQVQRRYAREWV
jgi:hypothetical protein